MSHSVIKQISLEGIKATGKTKHIIGNHPMPKPILLQIAQYDNDPGFYLFYLDENNEIMTDTWHETIEHALAQAEWEFETPPDGWVTII